MRCDEVFSLGAACTLSKALSHFMNNSTSFSSVSPPLTNDPAPLTHLGTISHKILSLATAKRAGRRSKTSAKLTHSG